FRLLDGVIDEARGCQHEQRNGDDEARVFAITVDELARLHGLASMSTTRTDRQRVDISRGMKYSSQSRIRSAFARTFSLYGGRVPMSNKSGSSIAVIRCWRAMRSLTVSDRTSFRSRL